MSGKDRLKDKKVLIVDDEQDVLALLKDFLAQCEVVTASTFEEAKDLLETQYFDLVLLDIMGVDGYKLLEIAIQREVTAVMLTAHALSPDHMSRSYKEGAAYFMPKEGMSDIVAILNEILEDKEKGKNPWVRWINRWVTFYDRKFGPDWRDKDKEFWEQFPDWD